MEMGVDDAERRVTILQPLGDHPHRTHVEQLVELEVFLLHLAPDAVDVFRAAVDFGLDAGLGKRIAQGLYELADVALSIESFLIELLGDLLVGIRVQVTEGEIFELPLELTYAEAVGKGRIDVGDLLGHQHPGLFIRQLGFPQAGDPLRQLDDDSAHILHHGEQHAAHVVHLLREVSLRCRVCRERMASISSTPSTSLAILGPKSSFTFSCLMRPASTKG